MNITDALRSLVGTKLSNNGHAASMVWLRFENGEGKAFALHFQCPCRFEKCNRIIVANGDMYCPTSSYAGDYSDFEYDVYGDNLYDEKVIALENIYYVSEYRIGRYNEIKIIFTEGLEFNSFSYNSTSEEQWRFFEVFDASEEGSNAENLKADGRRHYVVTPMCADFNE